MTATSATAVPGVAAQPTHVMPGRSRGAPDCRPRPRRPRAGPPRRGRPRRPPAPGSPTHRPPRPPARRPRRRSAPITRSAAPWTSVRASSGAWSAIIVEAATVANDQPRPSRNSPAKICHELPSGDGRAERQRRPAARPHPRRAPAAGPRRSASSPTSGENANMPSTWTLITMPITRSSAPPCSMCSGVITITATITACARGQPGDGVRRAPAAPGRACTARPHDGAGRRPRPARPPPRGRAAAGRDAGRPRRPPARREHPDAAERRTARSARGCRAGRPAAGGGPVRLGPATAPIVVAQTTIDSARARWRGGREVGGGVPRAAVRRRRRAEQHRAHQQQRHRADDAGHHRERRRRPRRGGSR